MSVIRCRISGLFVPVLPDMFACGVALWIMATSITSPVTAMAAGNAVSAESTTRQETISRPWILPASATAALAEGDFNPALAKVAGSKGALERGVSGCLNFWTRGPHRTPDSLIGGLILGVISAPLCGIAAALHEVLSSNSESEAAESLIQSLKKYPALQTGPLKIVQERLRDRGFGELQILSDMNLKREREYDGELHVFQVATGLHMIQDNPLFGLTKYRFVLSAQGQLIKASDNTVVQTFSTDAMTSLYSAGELPAMREKLIAELEAALRRAAVALVDLWMAPILPCAPPERPERRQMSLGKLVVEAATANVLVQAIAKSTQQSYYIPLLVRVDDFEQLVDDLESQSPPRLARIMAELSIGTLRPADDAAVESVCIIPLSGRAVELARSQACETPWRKSFFSAHVAFQSDAVATVNQRLGAYQGVFVCGLDQAAKWSDQMRNDVVQFLRRLPGNSFTPLRAGEAGG